MDQQGGTDASHPHPTTFAGIDWASRSHAVCVIDATGSAIERYEVEHSEAGLRRLVRRLSAAQVHGVAIERPDGPVIDALLEADLRVVIIASRQVKALRSRYGLAGNKDDRADAYVLADVLRTLQRVDGELVLLEPKTERSRRTIHLPEVVLSALRGHRTKQKMERLVAGATWMDSGHVFTTSRGTPLDAAAVTRSFQRALKKAGLPHQRFHDLRHSAATFLLAQGFTLEGVKNLLGHSSIVLTSNTYGHVLEQRQRQVAMGMDAVLGR